MLAGCAYINSGGGTLSTPEPTSGIDDNIPLFPTGKRISVNNSDSSKFVTNLLGSNYLLFRSHTDFYWTETIANDVMKDLNMRLPEAKWQLTTDWDHRNALILSTWQKGDLKLSILLLDDLDKVSIESLSKNYGISGPVVGSTLLVMNIIDRAAPLH
jgi:hypothetical protein